MTTPLRKSDDAIDAYQTVGSLNSGPVATSAPATLTPAEVREHIDGIAAFLGGSANVIMQLALKPVGYGVMESDVHTGSVMLVPAKRLRTTLTYIAVALMGDEGDRAAYRAAVNGAHRTVHTKPTSPVKYNAFDPKLQLWVASCMYWGLDDLYQRLRGPMTPELAEAFYQHCARFGTTLQMRQEMWPATRDEFYVYWEENLATRTIDDPTREYFNALTDLRMISKPLQRVFGPFHRFVTTALLPPHLRAEMGMTWTPRQERRFVFVLRALAAVWSKLPTVIRLFPYNFYLADMRLRRRFGRPLI
ncbi:oxygenase MpaB family protein [Nocardia sp. NPDC057668]|uniref:oxygenase MpaB family protein n=1 Tax=Nocardia sp. NPDC057668 TaxID=3346202 RepID=UPI00366F1DEF